MGRFRGSRRSGRRERDRRSGMCWEVMREGMEFKLFPASEKVVEKMVEMNNEAQSGV